VRSGGDFCCALMKKGRSIPPTSIYALSREVFLMSLNTADILHIFNVLA